MSSNIHSYNFQAERKENEVQQPMHSLNHGHASDEITTGYSLISLADAILFSSSHKGPLVHSLIHR